MKQDEGQDKRANAIRPYRDGAAELWPSNLTDEEFRAAVALLNAEVLSEIAGEIARGKAEREEKRANAIRPYGRAEVHCG